jgi:hypothetical protein
VLEMLTALRSERYFDLKCLFFYGPAEAHEFSHTWSLPDELRSALADPERWLETEVPLFARRISDLNGELGFHSAAAPLFRERCILRLRRSIERYRRGSLQNADLPLSSPPRQTKFQEDLWNQLALVSQPLLSIG